MQSVQRWTSLEGEEYQGSDKIFANPKRPDKPPAKLEISTIAIKASRISTLCRRLTLKALRQIVKSTRAKKFSIDGSPNIRK